MSCLKANVTLTLSDIKASVSACRKVIAQIVPESSCVIADADIEKAIQKASLSLLQSRASSSVDVIGSGVNAVIKLICVPRSPEKPDEKEYYLEIEPNEIIWVYQEFERDVNVYSNTDWIVE
jgi:hypothetical protein